MRINRIRLEFKVSGGVKLYKGNESINRIRLEFKERRQQKQGRGGQVLIESDWNLKGNRYTGG